ncbi:hypothetical protein K0M31_007153 [Melipona bicolor]|uniref:Uncharacterized protein n=1 Tax=Melipona bicolor TaxID=60889 RepID=A0AA40FRV3_9HYME|nr:hypothetical protein K0M31_007153 [Melipona bicolor]
MKEQDSVTNKSQTIDSFMIDKEGPTEDQYQSTKGERYGKDLHIDNKIVLRFMEELMREVKKMRKEFKQVRKELVQESIEKENKWKEERNELLERVTKLENITHTLQEKQASDNSIQKDQTGR